MNTHDNALHRTATLMADGRERTLTDVCVNLGISDQTARRHLRKLLAHNLVTRGKIGPNQTRVYRKVTA